MQSAKKGRLLFCGIALALALLMCAVCLFAAAEDTASAANLGQGSTGDKVSEMQRKLKNWGYYDGSVDGIFGSGTRKAV